MMGNIWYVVAVQRFAAHCLRLPQTNPWQISMHIQHISQLVYMQSFTVYFFRRPCPKHIFHRKRPSPNSPAVRSSLRWSGCGCLAVAGSSSFTAFPPAAPIATLAPHGQTNRSLEVNLQVARCWQRPLHARTFWAPKRGCRQWRVNKSQQKSSWGMLRHAQTRRSRILKLMSIRIVWNIYWNYWNISVVRGYANAAAGCFYLCDVQKNVMPFAHPFETVQIPFHFATCLFALYDSWKITISHKP